jgi:heme exporter protein D
MTYLPFVAASYGLGIGVPMLLGVSAWLRGRRAQARLAAIDPRGTRMPAEPDPAA